MRNKTFLFFLLFIVSVLHTFSQGKKFIYYFDAQLNSTDRSKSLFTGNGILKDNILTLEVVENKTQHTLIREHFTDSSLSVYDGLLQSYFINGVQEQEGNFKNNKEQGIWKKWNDKGQIIDSTMYDDGKKIFSATFSYHKNGQVSYYDLNDTFHNSEYKASYDDQGVMYNEVSFNGNNGILKSYKDNKIIRVDTVFSKEEIEASYPKGEAMWVKYVQDILVKNGDALIKDNQSGTCRVRFIIDKDGTVMGAEALTMKGSLLAEIAVKAIMSSTKWNPAKQYGRFVKAFREQPFTFTFSYR